MQKHTAITTIDVIAGARPNFIKVAALFAIADQFPKLHLRLIHTGQHYDPNMSKIFLNQFNLPEPALYMGVGSGTHAEQTGNIMNAYELWLRDNRPDLTLVVGDVNSTIACALVAAKAGIPIAHVEAGLRSGDRAMPEEINRILTDSLSDYMFVTEPSAIANLVREGRPVSGIHFVGHVMVDTLFRMLPSAEPMHICDQLGLDRNEYAYITLHRPSNVDVEKTLTELAEQLHWLSQHINIVFPVHPRTKARLQALNLYEPLSRNSAIRLIDPVGYLESLSLLADASIVVTDSGGLQEESTALGVPCLTLRENTERPITIQQGTNVLIGHNWDLFRNKMMQFRHEQTAQKRTTIPYWDGNAGQRILRILEHDLCS